MTRSFGVTEAIAEFAVGIRASSLPPDVCSEAKRLTLDAIGNAIGGAGTEVGKTTRRFVEINAVDGPVSVIGMELNASAILASYANGRLADIIDASDTFMSVHHLGVPAVMAALSLGAERKISGAELLAAVAVGVEAGARIGSAVGAPRQATTIPGMPPNLSAARLPVEELAAVISSAKAIGLDAERLCHAIGICGANAARHATPWGVSDRLPDQKYQDYGVITQTGVMAALLAESGMTSSRDPLGGPPGLWRLCGVPSCDFQLLLGDIGSKWFLKNTTFKPWPSCKWTQYGLTAFSRLQRDNRLSAAEIERIVVDSHIFGTAGYFRNQNPQTMISCAFNYPHALAMAALSVPPGPWWYSRSAIESENISAFRRRVDVEAEPYTKILESSVVDGQLRELPTRVTAFARGRVFVAETAFAWGDPFSELTRFSDEDLFNKFLYMGSPNGGSDANWLAHARRIHDTVNDLDRLPNVRHLMDMLSSIPVRTEGYLELNQ